MEERRGSVVGGVILVMLGLSFLAMQFFDAVSGAIVPLGLGVAFLVAHLIYRNYGFLVPGGILTGLGTGLLIQDVVAVRGETTVLGLGAGFLSIWLIDQVTRTGPRQGAWWPLIPGGILTLSGLASVFPDVSAAIFDYGWPVVLIALGAFIIVRGMRTREP